MVAVSGKGDLSVLMLTFFQNNITSGTCIQNGSCGSNQKFLFCSDRIFGTFKYVSPKSLSILRIAMRVLVMITRITHPWKALPVTFYGCAFTLSIMKSFCKNRWFHEIVNFMVYLPIIVFFCNCWSTEDLKEYFGESAKRKNGPSMLVGKRWSSFWRQTHVREELLIDES